MPRRLIAGSYGKKPPDCFPQWLHQLHSHQQCSSVQFSSVQSLSRVRLFETPWIVARQASLSITNSWSLLKLMSISSQWCHPAISSSVVPFSSCPQSLPASGSFLIGKVKVAQLCLTLPPHGPYSPWNSPGQNTGVGSLSLLQGIFLGRLFINNSKQTIAIHHEGGPLQLGLCPMPDPDSADPSSSSPVVHPRINTFHSTQPCWSRTGQTTGKACF